MLKKFIKKKTNRIITKPDIGITPINLFYSVFNLTNNKGLETLIKKNKQNKTNKNSNYIPSPNKDKASASTDSSCCHSVIQYLREVKVRFSVANFINTHLRKLCDISSLVMRRS